MKTISLNKNQITESIILLLGSEKTRPDIVNKITGVYNFKGITEGTKLRIDRIIKTLSKEEIEFNKSEIKTVKEFYVANSDIIFTQGQIDDIFKKDYSDEEMDKFLRELKGEKLEELNRKILELINTTIEIQIEPFSLSKIEDTIADDGINYTFVYDNFAE